MDQEVSIRGAAAAAQVSMAPALIWTVLLAAADHAAHDGQRPARRTDGPLSFQYGIVNRAVAEDLATGEVGNVAARGERSIGLAGAAELHRAAIYQGIRHVKRVGVENLRVPALLSSDAARSATMEGECRVDAREFDRGSNGGDRRPNAARAAPLPMSTTR